MRVVVGEAWKPTVSPTRLTGEFSQLPGPWVEAGLAIPSARESGDRSMGTERGRARWPGAACNLVVGRPRLLQIGRFRLDVQTGLGGEKLNPIVVAGRGGLPGAALHRDVHGLHFPFAVALVALAVIVCRRLPLSYGVFSVAIVVTSLAAGNLNSIERHGPIAFLLLMAPESSSYRACRRSD